ncbi:MAG: aminotransferase class III-fold pyridoxal phosphate-dependent enzyme [Candidatus Riflebacteria bacterium]|nr:aminotransferase class III-fold pyridoxal phosphate-dependent enzyme [Candidatus Riflebacteria bacterium]
MYKSSSQSFPKPRTNKEYLDLEKEYCSFGDTTHYLDIPKIFEYCEGSFLYDENNTPFLDLQMWYSAVNFGYKNKRINDAAKAQLDRLPQLASQYLHHEKIELATRLCKYNQEKFGNPGRVHFNVGGSQAIEDALKLIRNYKSGKSLMFAFEGGYHGRTLGASAITSSYRYRRRFGHFSERAQFIPFPYCFRCPFGKKNPDCDMFCLQQFERLFDTEYYGVWDAKAEQCEFAAFFVEMIQGTGGYVIPPKGYFSRLQAILEKRKILLVDDEIQMGIFRTGKFWAAEHFGVKPDVIVFGKALSNGLNPLSGIWAKEEFINPAIFPPGSTHSTFAGNPLGTAIGLEVIKMVSEEDYETMIMRKGAYFLNGLKELKKKFKVIADVDGLGLALRVEICHEDGFTPNKNLTDAIFNCGLQGNLEYMGKKHGLVLDIGGYYKNVITLAPAFSISEDELDMALALLEQVFTRCTK